MATGLDQTWAISAKFGATFDHLWPGCSRRRAGSTSQWLDWFRPELDHNVRARPTKSWSYVEIPPISLNSSRSRLSSPERGPVWAHLGPSFVEPVAAPPPEDARVPHAPRDHDPSAAAELHDGRAARQRGAPGSMRADAISQQNPERSSPRPRWPFGS